MVGARSARAQAIIRARRCRLNIAPREKNYRLMAHLARACHGQARAIRLGVGAARRDNLA